jgi:hypothetical protein
MVWPSGRTPQASNHEGMMRWCGPGRTGNLRSLVCKGGHRSKRYRRLWPRRGKPCLLAYFLPKFLIIFQRGGLTARTCYALVETQTARLASVRICLFHLRSWLTGHFKITYQSHLTNNVSIGCGQCPILPRFKDGDPSGVLPHCWKVMGAKPR